MTREQRNSREVRREIADMRRIVIGPRRGPWPACADVDIGRDEHGVFSFVVDRARHRAEAMRARSRR